MSAEAQGFKTAVVSNVQPGVDQRVRVDLKLEIGDMTETVRIQADDPAAPDLQLRPRHHRGHQATETLPLNGRNFVQLTRTVPGVARGIPGATSTAPAAWRGALGLFSANGQRPRDNNYMLDERRQQRDLAADLLVLPQRGRRAGRVQAADEH